MKRKAIFMICCIIIDELIKAVIYYNFMQIDLRIFNGRMGFVPFINSEQLSIFNNELNWGLSVAILVLLNVLELLVLPVLYIRFKKKEYTNGFFDYSLLLIMAGAVCSLIDKITLGGSLDYILLLGQISDLKDIYLFLGVISIIIYVITYFQNSQRSKQDHNK